MTLRTRLSLFSALLFSIVILAASAIIYFSFRSHAERQEYRSLEYKTLLAGLFYLEKDEISSAEHQSIASKLQRNISRRNIIVIDAANHRFEGLMGADIAITPDFLNEARRNGMAKKKTEDYFYNGLFYHDNQGDFVIVTREATTEFDAQMNALLQILAAAFVVGILLTVIFSQLLGRIAYAPILKMIDELKKRDYKNFSRPIILDTKYPEMTDLADTYNELSAELERTFSIQKNFIDYVSHELRTPIAAMLGTLEVLNQKQRTVDDYTAANKQLKHYAEDLGDTIDQMLLLSGARTRLEIHPVRLDEIIWSIYEQLTVVDNANLQIDIQVEDSKLLTINANEKLLRLAIQNIVQNAVKYSDRQTVNIILDTLDGHLRLAVVDKGIGIPAADLEKITDNFFRADNAADYSGKGIGLSLASIIFRLHNIRLEIESSPGGTAVYLIF